MLHALNGARRATRLLQMALRLGHLLLHFLLEDSPLPAKGLRIPHKLDLRQAGPLGKAGLVLLLVSGKECVVCRLANCVVSLTAALQQLV